jgi:hypothetical protein
MMKRAILVLGALTAVLMAKPAVAFDQAAAQAACGNDVFALCQQAVPDQGRITACLNAHRREVSPACHQFMANTAGEMRHSAKRRGGRQIETIGGAPED